MPDLTIEAATVVVAPTAAPAAPPMVRARDPPVIMVIRVVEFSRGGTKLERCLHKNQHTPRKLLNIEFRINVSCQK